MLRLYPFIIETVQQLRPVLETIAAQDADLARQARRAVSSGALNTAEAMGSRGRNRAARYHTALGSMREVRACIDVANALGYIRIEPSLLDAID